MKPYYEDDLITLYHADCLEHLHVLDQADVMVTDPPYGMAYESGWVRDRTRRPIHGDDTTELRDQVLAEWGGETRPRVRKVEPATARECSAPPHLVEGGGPGHG